MVWTLEPPESDNEVVIFPMTTEPSAVYVFCVLSRETDTEQQMSYT